MSQPTPSYVDGYVTPERQVTVIPDVEFPFENYPTPDTYARILDRRYDVTPKFFAPKISTRTSWTNYLLYSETFANAAWTKTNITNVDNSLANPNDGQVTMASGLETVTNAEHAYQQAYTFTAVPHTLSWIIQPNGRTWFRVKANDGTTNFTKFFNLTGDGVPWTQANCTGTVSLVAPGIYRVSITFTPLAAAGNVYLNYSTDGASVSYVGDVTLGAYVWAAQIVRASTAGPVIITTTVARTVSAPNLDESDPFAYLVWERSPVNYVSAVAGVERKFARIPKPQTSFPGSRYFQLPAVTNDYQGLSQMPVYDVATQQNVGNGAYSVAASAIYTSDGNALYGPTKNQSARLIGVASGGTFTLTYKASTTAALNWNDSNATIAAAVNGLASVISDGLTATVSNVLAGGVGVSGYLTIGWTGGVTSTNVTMNATSLTVNTSNNPTSVLVSYGTGTTILLPDHYTIASHGFNASLDIAAVSTAETIAVFPVASWGSIDSNTIWLPGGVVSFQLVFGTFNRTYIASGTYLLRSREIETFYLAGVSTGITTVADITSPLGLQNPADFIAALMTLTGFQTYQSEGPRPWMGTLIYSVSAIDLNISDIT